MNGAKNDDDAFYASTVSFLEVLIRYTPAADTRRIPTPATATTPGTSKPVVFTTPSLPSTRTSATVVELLPSVPFVTTETTRVTLLYVRVQSTTPDASLQRLTALSISASVKSENLLLPTLVR